MVTPFSPHCHALGAATDLLMELDNRSPDGTGNSMTFKGWNFVCENKKFVCNSTIYYFIAECVRKSEILNPVKLGFIILLRCTYSCTK